MKAPAQPLGTRAGWAARLALGLARRPGLWAAALGQARALTPTQWWARWPPLPGPSEDYLAFRLLTMYGSASRLPEPAEVLAWLAWCRSARRWSR